MVPRTFPPCSLPAPRSVTLHPFWSSDVNKDLTFKAKDKNKDQTLKAKDQTYKDKDQDKDKD